MTNVRSATMKYRLLEEGETHRAVLTVDEVYEGLDRAARASGEGARTSRIAAIAGLLGRATPAEAKYIVRMATGKLRLGVGDMTILDALAEVFAGGKHARKELERAYNLTSDLGYVAAVVAEGGLEKIRKIHVVVGKPIRPMLAERLGDPREIPTTLFVFDTIYVDGKDLTEEPYQERREALTHVVKLHARFRMATFAEVTSVDELERVFEQAVQDGCEGLVCKATGGVYQAGARGWQWIKFKREYRSEMTDAVDLVVVGAIHGRGRRGGSYGALLMAAYDDKDDNFKTVCKLGTGFSDKFLGDLPKMLRRYERSERPVHVNTRIVPDVWLEPALVFEVIGAEITLSPVHTAGWDVVRNGSGLAIRFPRFTRMREDKSPTDATTVKELVEMYRRRVKKAG